MVDSVRKIDPGTYRISKCVLINYEQKQIDITQLISNLEIVESLYTTFASYKFTIVDAVALLEKYIITGNEKIEIEFLKKREDSADDEMVQKKLAVTGITDYTKGSQNGQAYIMTAILETAMATSFKRVSRSVSGSLGEIINTLYSEVVYDEANDALDVIDGGAEGNYRIVFPNYNMNHCFNMMLKRAQTSNGNIFFFFETLWHKQKLTSLNEIMRRPAIETYEEKYNERSDKFTDENLKENQNRIKDITSILGISHFNSFKEGAFVSKVFDVDIALKTYTTNVYNIMDEKDKMPSMDKDIMLSEGYTISGKPFSEYSDIKQYMTHRNTLAFSDDGSTGNIHYKTDTSIAKRKSLYENQKSINHVLTINGDKRFRPGERVDLKMAASIEPELTDEKKDELMSGSYYIASVKHRFESLNKYSMEISIKKDRINIESIKGKYDHLDG